MVSRVGSIADAFPIIVGAIIVGIAFIFALSMIVEIDKTTDAFGDKTFDDARQALTYMDNGAIFIVGAFYITSWILAFRIPTSPVFFIPAVIVNGLAIYVSAVFSNTFTSIVTSNSIVQNAANYFPAMSALFNNFPLVIGVLNTVLLIVTFIAPTRNVQVGA